MANRKRYSRGVIVDILFIAYILILLRITVLRNSFGEKELLSGEINFIPFADLIAVSEQSFIRFLYLFIGNILWFMPWGAYICGVKKCRLYIAVLSGFVLSLIIEIMQYIFGTGVSELDDLILNTAGALVGGVVSKIFFKWRNEFLMSEKVKAFLKYAATVFFIIILLAFWTAFGGFALIILTYSSFIKTLIYINAEQVVIWFILINLILLIIFRRKLKEVWEYPLFLIVSSVITLILCFIAVSAVYIYYNNFSSYKWSNAPGFRYLMIDSLEKKYEITGMSKQEIVLLLGEPQNINDLNGGYEYFVCDGLIDPVTYDVYFYNDTVVKTAVIEH